MAYQLNEDQLKQARASAWNDEAMKKEESWMERSDNGYGDQYRALKQLMDHVRERYLDQLNYLPRKKAELHSEYKRKLWHMIFVIALPFIIEGLAALFLIPATASGFFSVLYHIFLYLLSPMAIVTCFFYFLPITVRDFFNCAYRRRKLEADEDVVYGQDAWISLAEAVEVGKRKDITFREEEQFLRSILSAYDSFMQRAEREDLEHLGKNDHGFIDLSADITSEQQGVLDTMQKLSRYIDVQARIGDERKESGPVTLIVGFAIMLAIAIGAVIIF